MTQQLGKYELLESLGAGATAEVFRARDTVLGREVALKVLKPALVSDPSAFARFAQEAQAAAQLFHPHIALVLDMGSGGDRYFIALQYVPGQALDKALAARGPLPWAEVLRLAEHIGGALEFAHQRGFLHRDVKPANIIRTPEGEYVLTDFGLTRAMMTTGLTSHTGAALGTPAYIPPEIWLGEKATPATDEYALACVLVEALTGQVLFAGETPPAVMTRHILKGAELPVTWPTGAPEGVGAVLAQALQKSPADRHGGPGALRQALHELLHQQAARQQQREEEATRRQREAEQVTFKQRESEGVARQQGNTLVLTLASGVDITFTRVSAGEFLMGSDPQVDQNALEDEQPQHKVYLDTYWIGKYPVTNAQYAAFARATNYRPPDHWRNGKCPAGKEQHPVVNVSWEDATAFCQWVTQITGQEIRLPTEAEWEKAARGMDGRAYPWGNEPPDASRCNFGGNERDTTPVSKYSPRGNSPYSCADMAGNVWEWTAGWYGPYSARTQSSPTGPATGDCKVVRGGSWLHSEWVVHSACRYWNSPTTRTVSLGFRCIVMHQD